MTISNGSQGIFQSTLSVRRATWDSYSVELQLIFQSTLSVRRATGFELGLGDLLIISIHALRKESDLIRLADLRRDTDFNPRSP